MENRFNHTPPEGEQGWGAYVTPPPIPGQQNTEQAGQTNLCAQVRDWLPSLLENDGDVRPEVSSSLYAHLAACSGCAREFDEMQRVVALLEALAPAELPADFSGVIMRRIQTEMGPVQNASTHPTSAASSLSGEAAIDAGITDAAPKATPQAAHTTAVVAETRAKRTLALEQQAITHTGVRLWERLTLAGMFSAFLAFVLSTEWGRELLGVNLDTASAWLGQIGDTLRRVPVLSGIVALMLSALAHAGDVISDTYKNLGVMAARGLVLDVALCAGIAYLLARRQRGHRMRI